MNQKKLTKEDLHGKEEPIYAVDEFTGRIVKVVDDLHFKNVGEDFPQPKGFNVNGLPNKGL